MGQYRHNFKGRQGSSYGKEYPVRFDLVFGMGYVVYNVKTGEVYAKDLKSWEAPGRCVQENERLGFPCKPDISVIDSTP